MAQNDMLKRYLDAGLAFTQMTREKAEAIVKDLVKAGEIKRKEAEQAIDELIERSRKNTEDLVALVRAEVVDQLRNVGLEDLASKASGKVRKAAKDDKAKDKKPPAAGKAGGRPAKKAAAKAAKKAAPAKKGSTAEPAKAARKSAPAKKSGGASSGGGAPGTAGGASSVLPAEAARSESSRGSNGSRGSGGSRGSAPAKASQPARKAAKKSAAPAPAGDATKELPGRASDDGDGSSAGSAGAPSA